MMKEFIKYRAIDAIRSRKGDIEPMWIVVGAVIAMMLAMLGFILIGKFKTLSGQAVDVLN